MTILVKFYVKPPSGITERQPNEKEILRKRQEEATERGIGRDEWRRGHTDTGFPVYQNEKWVSLSAFWNDLKALDFVLTDIFWSRHPRKKWEKVVNLVFQQGEPFLLSDGLSKWVKDMFGATFEWLHVWDNRELGNPDSVILAHLIREETGLTQYLRIDKDGKYGLRPA